MNWEYNRRRRDREQNWDFEDKTKPGANRTRHRLMHGPNVKQ